MRFYRLSILVAILLGTIAIVQPIHWQLVTAVLVVIYLTVVAIGVFNMQLRLFNFSIHRADGVLLTFDDGPDGDKTPEILDTLKECGVKAIFFMIGRKVEQHPEIVQRLLAEGHLLGNHTYSHDVRFTASSASSCGREIDRCTQAIRRVGHQSPQFFRPPFGVTNPHIGAAIRKTGLPVVGWSVRSFDTVLTPAKCMRRIKRKTKADSIVLLHDTGCLSGDHIRSYIEHCRKQGFTFADTNAFVNAHA